MLRICAVSCVLRIGPSFTGIIDEVYLYKAALTQANITALATGKP